MHVLAFSYGKNLFDNSHLERERMQACATATTELRMIIFARDCEGLSVTKDGNLYLYPTGGRTKVGMLVRALLLGGRLLRAQNLPEEWVITTQDPFEAGLVGYILARLFNVPLNIQEHGDFFSTPHWRLESTFNCGRSWLGRFLLRRADTVRVVSTRMLTTMARLGVDKTKLRLLSVLVPLNRFLEASSSLAARKLFPANSVIILTVARLVAQKNISLLLQSFASVSQGNQAARLLIVGTGPEQMKLTKLATDLGLLEPTDPKVIFLPWTDDVPAYMKSVDIYALSSNYEGYARVIPEAMAAGLPVIMTDVGCAGEVLISGEGGLIIPVGDQSAYSQALQELVTDSLKRPGFASAGHISMKKSLIIEAPSYAQAWLSALT